MSRLGQRSQPNRRRQTSTREPPLGPVIETVDPDGVDTMTKFLPDTKAKIEDVTYVASYNWIDKDAEGGILVPGKPPCWAPAKGDIRIREDTGVYYRDKNAVRSPDYPWAPAISACLVTSPTLLDDVDVVACGSTLGNLLRFVRKQDKKCRMLVERVGKAFFLVRRENSPTETIPDVRGFGHGFPEACTEWAREVKNSASHQRIIKYRFGGLNLLVRFEADGYLRKTGSSMHANTTVGIGAAHKSPHKRPVDMDRLVQTMSASGVSSAASNRLQSSTGTKKPWTIRSAGRTVSQSQLFDLKTRSIRKAEYDHMQDELPRLWVAQIPNFILAFHSQGLFREANIQVKKVKNAVLSWESQHQAELTRLAALIHHIIKLSSIAGTKNGKLEVTITGLGRLYVREQLEDAGDALPKDIKAAWELRCTHGGKESDAGDASETVDGGGSVLKWEDPGQDLTGCSEACNYCGQCV